MSENNKMPELAPTDIVQLRDGRCGIILMNNKSSTGLSVFVHCSECPGLTWNWHLSSYEDNICKDEQASDIVKVWKANANIQIILMNAFFYGRRVPSFAKPDWVEPSKKMTLKEIEKALDYSIEIIDEE